MWSSAEWVNGSFDVQFFQGFIFTPYQLISMQGHAAQIFKSENIVKQCLYLP